VVLGAGIAGLALFLAVSTATRMPVLVSFDEAVYKLAAVQDATGGVDAIVHDGISRGVARLYSLLLAPVFAAAAGDTGIDIGRALGTVAFALAAVPVYLLARDAMASRWKAVAAALLSIAVPWATISTVLFSEAVAYPLFALALLVMAWTLRAPSPRRDVLALAVLGALVLVRPQFAGVGLAWLGLVAALALLPARRRAGSWGAAARATARRLPLTSALVALGALLAVALVATGHGADLAHRLGGPYVSSEYSPNAGVAKLALFEAAMLALGTGLVPLVLAPLWLGPALRGTRGEDARRIALVGVAAVAAVWAFALAAVGQFPGPAITEERYFIYAVPVLFVAALAALELPRPPRWALGAGAVLVLVLLALAPITAGLSSERAFLVPVAATATNLAGRLDPAHAADLAALSGTRRLLLLATGVLVLGLAAAASRGARWAVLVPAIILQLGLGGYALATMHGKVPGVPGATGAPPSGPLAWIDRTTAGGPDVPLLTDGNAAESGGDVTLAFFNDEANRTLRFPGIVGDGPPYPVSSLPAADVAVATDLSLAPAPPQRFVAATAGSPYVQLAGRRVSADATGREELLELARPARATWVARGLGAHGLIAAQLPVIAAPAKLTLTFATGPEPGHVAIRLGDARARAVVPASGALDVAVDACGGTAPRAGDITPRGGQVFLRAVRTEPC
jgi:hypothetical protein